MRWLLCASVVLIEGCGARSDLEAPTIDEPVIEPPDAGVLTGPGPIEPPVCVASRPTPSASCGPLAFRIETEAACAIDLAAGASLDAEGFMTANARECDPCGPDPGCVNATKTHCNRIFTMNRFGAGHIIGWCDSTTLDRLIAELDALTYLARTNTPRVALVGAGYPCPNADEWGEYLGETLPDDALDPASLAAEWDVVIACGALSGADGVWQATLQSYVRDYGGGLLVVEDYKLACAANQASLVALNALTEPAGFLFMPIDLEWAPIEVELPCVADYPFR